MNHLRMIREFLQQRQDAEEIPSAGYPFVTISREAGAGGHLLAYVLTTDFLKEQGSDLFQGWHVFDKQLCEVVAQDPDVGGSAEAVERDQRGSELGDFVGGLLAGRSRQFKLYKATFKIVRMLAALGKVILVGRAAMWITRDLPGGIHVRLVAPRPRRVEWMMRKLNADRAQAERTIDAQDGERRMLVRDYFNADIADPLLYDAVWNTDRADMHAISASVIDLIRRRA